jgi:LuxR family transcriptional regulator, maltose regulon positive regulatory protein
LLAENGRSTLQPPSLTYIKQILRAFPQSPKLDIPPMVETLTPRELEILQLLATGLTYAQTADKLTITNNTLKTHIKRIYSKLNVQNRVQAILVAKDAGILA